MAELEQQRTSMMLELVNKEKDMMQQSYARDYAELTRLREQYNQLSTENAQHCEELLPDSCLQRIQTFEHGLSDQEADLEDFWQRDLTGIEDIEVRTGC
ncbi:MAG: hypothetical protein ACLUN5_18910 [Oscillospiraceae bacterium]